MRVPSCFPGISARLAVFTAVVWAGACSDSTPDPAPRSLGRASSTPAVTAAPPAPPTAEPPTPAPLARLACAPCKKIAFTSSRDGNDEIYSVNADGTGLTRLTHDPARDDHAAWSPDGARIAFMRGADADYTLVVMNADGSNVLRQTLPHPVFYPTWSRDGTKITYTAVSDGSANLWIVDADGGFPLLLFSAPGWDSHPSWSPDGSKLALVSDWFAYDFVYDVFLVDPDGSHFTPLTDGDIFDGMNYLWPSWSPDGARIATTVQREVGIDLYRAYLGVMSRNGSGLTRLISAAPWSKSTWSPDGTTIAFASLTFGAPDVAWIKADGSASGTIVTDGWNPAWQP